MVKALFDTSVLVAALWSNHPKHSACISRIDRQTKQRNSVKNGLVPNLISFPGLSHFEGKGVNDPKGIPLSKGLFKTNLEFNIGAFGVLLVCAFLYAFFW